MLRHKRINFHKQQNTVHIFTTSKRQSAFSKWNKINIVTNGQINGKIMRGRQQQKILYSHASWQEQYQNMHLFILLKIVRLGTKICEDIWMSLSFAKEDDVDCAWYSATFETVSNSLKKLLPNVVLSCSSHWYLAVICFPGLANSEVVPFIPSNANRVEFDDESNDNTVSIVKYPLLLPFIFQLDMCCGSGVVNAADISQIPQISWVSLHLVQSWRRLTHVECRNVLQQGK